MKSVSNQRGQGMTEYIILVALIAVAAIAAVRFFGSKTKEGFENAAAEVGAASDSSSSAGDGLKSIGKKALGGL